MKSLVELIIDILLEDKELVVIISNSFVGLFFIGVLSTETVITGGSINVKSVNEDCCLVDLSKNQ